jgi:uncharacterized protein involved in outer membrane biogenesis
MTKFLKRFFQLLAALIVILLIATVVIVNVVDPNRFKGEIEREVLAETGFVLTINGPIQWRWYPMLSLELNRIAIQNPEPASNVILIAKTIQAECDVIPLMSGKSAFRVTLKDVEVEQKIKIDQIKATIAVKDKIIDLAPVEIHFAKSQQKIILKIDLREKTPKIYLIQTPQDFEINDMLALFGIKDKLSGKTRLSMNLSASGTNLRALQHSLSGKANIEITNGKFQGIDLVALLKNSQSSIHSMIDALTRNLSINSLSVINTELSKWKTDRNSNAFTPFHSLTATANITNGLIQNPDLSIQDSEYGIKGAGTINPAANTIQYQATLQLKNNPYPPEDKAGTFLFETPLHIQIQGSLNDPKIRPDLSTYTNSALEYAQRELVKKVIQKTIGQAIEKATGNNGALQDTLHKALGDILKP